MCYNEPDETTEAQAWTVVLAVVVLLVLAVYALTHVA